MLRDLQAELKKLEALQPSLVRPAGVVKKRNFVRQKLLEKSSLIYLFYSQFLLAVVLFALYQFAFFVNFSFCKYAGF